VAAPTPPVIPADSEVAGVRLQSIGSSLGSQYDVNLTMGPDVAALLAWLRGIDWTPSAARDLAGVALAHVGHITLSKTDGSREEFGLSGGVLIDGRWEWPADTAKLETIVRNAGGVITPLSPPYKRP